MVLLLIEKRYPLDEVIFYDTEMEFDSIYHNRDRIKEILTEKCIKFTELHSKYSFLFDMFIRPVKYRNPENKPYPIHYGYEWCGSRVRWGTSGKLSAIKKHYRDTYGDVEIFEYVGIAADEPGRIRDDIHKLYPLVEWNMTEKDCLQYCYNSGFDWNEETTATESGYIDLYTVFDRVSCYMCANKNLKELKNMYIYFYDTYWQRLRGLQSRIDSPMKGTGKSVFQLEERFKKELNGALKEELKED